MATMDIRVDQLQAGDVLPFTKQTVLTVKARGPYTDLLLRRANGREQMKSWRSATIVRIERAVPA